jgi:hypothetical protein
MKKSLKILYTVLSVVVILLIVAVIAIKLFADSAVKMAIESAGTKALKVGVAVDSVDLSILGGKIRFQNLVIDNPPGYKHEKLLELGDAKIAVEIGSLLTDIVNIKEIKFDGLNIVLEQRGISGNNLQDIMKALPAREAEPSEPGGKKLHIDTLEITNATAKVKLLPLPGKVDTQGAGILPEDMLGSLTSQLDKLGALPAAFLDQGGKLLNAGKDVGGGIIKGAGDATKGITDGIKGLFKPKEDKE